MTCWARRRGGKPRRSARPCSVTMTWVSRSVWSTWLTIGTMHEIAPPLAVDGERNIKMNALRAKSPEPPMPFMMLEPMRWVELTLPYMSASSMPFIARQPTAGPSRITRNRPAGCHHLGPDQDV